MRLGRPLRRTAFAVIAGFAVVACGSSDSTGGAPSQDAASDTSGAAATTPAVLDAEEAPGEAPEPGSPSTAPEILQFTGNLVGGGQLDASELSGRPTAFWFWSPT